MKALGTPTSDQPNPTPSCNGSPGTFLVSTGKVTDTSHQQKPGSEEVRIVKRCWQTERNVLLVQLSIYLSIYLSIKLPIYISIYSIYLSSLYLSICLSIFLSFFHLHPSFNPSMQIETIEKFRHECWKSAWKNSWNFPQAFRRPEARKPQPGWHQKRCNVDWHKEVGDRSTFLRIFCLNGSWGDTDTV